MMFFNNIRAKHWIQIESYLQIQIPFGRKDPYTLDKQRFSEYLNLEIKSRTSTAVHHLYLPHIFGAGDRPGRLISSALSSFTNGKPFETSNATQLLPILHLSDAVSAITKFIENPMATAGCPPFLYGSVRELLELIASQFQNTNIVYGRRPDPVDADFPRVEFPQCVEGWQPKMQLKEFLEWVKVQNG
jgi:nucleoside-diphosphate-sugar epimerase